MNRLSQLSTQVVAGLGSLVMTGVLMAYAIIPATPSIAPVIV